MNTKNKYKILLGFLLCNFSHMLGRQLVPGEPLPPPIQQAISAGNWEKVKDLIKQEAIRNAKYKQELSLLDCAIAEKIEYFYACPSVEIILAKESGRLEIVQILIEQYGFDVNEKTQDTESTPLHFASWEGYADIIKYLIEKGAEVNAKNRMGQTPLYCATVLRKINAIRCLIEKGANISLKTNDGKTALDLVKIPNNSPQPQSIVIKGKIIKRAVRRNNSKDIAKLLEETQAKYNEELLKAAEAGDWDKVKELVDKGADVNARIQDRDRIGNAPLHFAAEKGNLEIVEYLLDHGANVNPRNEWTGFEPLHFAVDNKHTEIVKVLVDHNADMQAVDYSGWYNPLHHAARNGFMEAVQYMVEKGADINVKTHGGQTPLDIAKQHHHQEIVEFLEEKMKENQ
jgi:ankyrin repeat protein